MKKLIGSVAVAVAAGGWAPSGYAQAMTGNELLSLIDTKNPAGVYYIDGIVDGYEIGMVQGVAGAKGHTGGAAAERDIQAVRQGVSTCFDLPQGVTMARLVDVIGNFLRNRPAARGERASIVVLSALSSAFPCGKK